MIKSTSYPRTVAFIVVGSSLATSSTAPAVAERLKVDYSYDRSRMLTNGACTTDDEHWAQFMQTTAIE